MRKLLRIALVVVMTSLLVPLAAEAHGHRGRTWRPHARHVAVHRYRHKRVRARRRRLADRRRWRRAYRGFRAAQRLRLLRQRLHRRPPQLPKGHQSAANLHPAFHRIAKGVGFWRGALLTPAGPVHLDALKVDLRYASVAPVAALSRTGGFTLARTSVMVRSDHAVAGINGSFFSFKSREPAGMLVVGGRILAGPTKRPALVVRQNGTASILPDRTAMEAGPFQAVGGGPTLLRNGHVRLWGRPHDIGGRQPRTAVGLCRGHEIVLLTIDGRSRGSVGATLSEEARYIKAMGAINAINLDGGGSTTMVVGGHVVNHPSDGAERAVSDALLVFRHPEKGDLPLVFRYSGLEFLGS